MGQSNLFAERIEKNAEQISVEISQAVDHSVEDFASIIEQTTATIQQLDGMVEEQVNRMVVLTEAIEQINQTAIALEQQ